MAFNQTKSKTKKTARDKAQTPLYLVRQVERLLGVTFLLDVCAEPATAKAPYYYTARKCDAPGAIGVDCFKRDWLADLEWATLQHYRAGGRLITPAVWMNPEFSDAETFVKKAVTEAARGVMVGSIVNHSSGAEWWREIVKPCATYVLTPDSRVEYLTPDGGPFMTYNKKKKRMEKSSPNFYSVLPIFTKVRPPGGAIEIPFMLDKPGRAARAESTEDAPCLAP